MKITGEQYAAQMQRLCDAGNDLRQELCRLLQENDNMRTSMRLVHTVLSDANLSPQTRVDNANRALSFALGENVK